MMIWRNEHATLDRQLSTKTKSNDVKSSFLVFFSLGKLALFSIAIAFVQITFAVQYKLSRHY